MAKKKYPLWKDFAALSGVLATLGLFVYVVGRKKPANQADEDDLLTPEEIQEELIGEPEEMYEEEASF